MSDKLTNEEVQMLNKLILEAVVHGADAGGSYNQNADGLIQAMGSFIEHYKLYNRYELKEIEVERFGAVWNVLQFIEIENE